MLTLTFIHKITVTIFGCVLSFCLVFVVCLVVEPDITMQKLKRYLLRFGTDVQKYFEYAIRSARADLRSEVANAYLDWLWWLIEPFCMMLIYALIFGVVFKASEPYFPVFIFSGLAMSNVNKKKTAIIGTMYNTFQEIGTRNTTIITTTIPKDTRQMPIWTGCGG